MAGEGTTQMAVLGALMPGQCLTVETLAAATGFSKREVVKAAGRLIGSGLAERAEVGCFTLTAEGLRWREEGREIKSGPKGKLTQACRRPRKLTLRDRLWAALRILRKASVPQLMELAGGEDANPNNANRYLAVLVKTGYLREMARRDPGTAITSNGFKRYLLVRDTGPAAPQYKPTTRAVFDPNTQDMFSTEVMP